MLASLSFELSCYSHFRGHGDDCMTEQEFSRRLAKLRTDKGVSARDMSLSIGQNPGYINNIETGKSMPSLTGIFYICDLLGITPKELFDTETQNPTKASELYTIAKGLSNEQLDLLIALAKGLQK